MFAAGLAAAPGADSPAGEPAAPAGKDSITVRREAANAVRARRHSRMVYSGVAVQAARSNPLQLINPFAPARYGSGEGNTARDGVTGRAEGVKVVAVGF